jgi:bacterioferritin-associated ferredoxin
VLPAREDAVFHLWKEQRLPEEEAVLEGAGTYLELQEHTKLGTVCGQCKEEAQRLLTEYSEKHFGKFWIAL